MKGNRVILKRRTFLGTFEDQISCTLSLIEEGCDGFETTFPEAENVVWDVARTKFLVQRLVRG